jgi:hypothetical protein
VERRHSREGLEHCGTPPDQRSSRLRHPSRPEAGESARIAVAHIIRANGTVGVYRITASTNPQVTAKVIEMLRAQVYEPPLLMGSPVAVRGEVTYRFER